jgi:hypothetical protein
MSLSLPFVSDYWTCTKFVFFYFGRSGARKTFFFVCVRINGGWKREGLLLYPSIQSMSISFLPHKFKCTHKHTGAVWFHLGPKDFRIVRASRPVVGLCVHIFRIKRRAYNHPYIMILRVYTSWKESKMLWLFGWKGFFAFNWTHKRENEGGGLSNPGGLVLYRISTSEMFVARK